MPRRGAGNHGDIVHPLMNILPQSYGRPARKSAFHSKNTLHDVLQTYNTFS